MGHITKISLSTIAPPPSRFRRKLPPDELLQLHTPGGDILVRKSAVEGSGDSWRLLTRRLYAEAKATGIAFEDRRTQANTSCTNTI